MNESNSNSNDIFDLYKDILAFNPSYSQNSKSEDETINPAQDAHTDNTIQTSYKDSLSYDNDNDNEINLEAIMHEPIYEDMDGAEQDIIKEEKRFPKGRPSHFSQKKKVFLPSDRLLFFGAPPAITPLLEIENNPLCLLSNFDWWIKDVELINNLSQFGHIHSLKILERPKDGRSLGIALAQFSNIEDIQQLISSINSIKLNPSVDTLLNSQLIPQEIRTDLDKNGVHWSIGGLLSNIQLLKICNLTSVDTSSLLPRTGPQTEPSRLPVINSQFPWLDPSILFDPKAWKKVREASGLTDEILFQNSIEKQHKRRKRAHKKSRAAEQTPPNATPPSTNQTSPNIVSTTQVYKTNPQLTTQQDAPNGQFYEQGQHTQPPIKEHLAPPYDPHQIRPSMPYERDFAGTQGYSTSYGPPQATHFPHPQYGRPIVRAIRGPPNVYTDQNNLHIAGPPPSYHVHSYMPPTHTQPRHEAGRGMPHSQMSRPTYLQTSFTVDPAYSTYGVYTTERPQHQHTVIPHSPPAHQHYQNTERLQQFSHHPTTPHTEHWTSDPSSAYTFSTAQAIPPSNNTYLEGTGDQSSEQQYSSYYNTPHDISSSRLGNY